MKTIKQVSKSLDIAPKTIRYYEDVGLLSPISRGVNGYRYFMPENIEELRLIKGPELPALASKNQRN